MGGIRAQKEICGISVDKGDHFAGNDIKAEIRGHDPASCHKAMVRWQRELRLLPSGTKAKQNTCLSSNLNQLWLILFTGWLVLGCSVMYDSCCVITAAHFRVQPDSDLWPHLL